MRRKKVAILQSSYIPWKGYFDIINSVDEFILYDEVQFTKRDWRNRNKIKSKNGLLWLTIPVEVKGKFFQKMNKTKICDERWGKTHWKTILCNYADAKYFKDYKNTFEPLYLNQATKLLSLVNFCFIKKICEILAIKTKLSWSNDYVLDGNKTGKLVNICRQAGATSYITGPAAKNYLEEEKFEEANIELIYFDYSEYPEYSQLFGDFVHEVSVLDLIFNEGPNAINFMKSFGSVLIR